MLRCQKLFVSGRSTLSPALSAVLGRPSRRRRVNWPLRMGSGARAGKAAHRDPIAAKRAQVEPPQRAGVELQARSRALARRGAYLIGFTHPTVGIQQGAIRAGTPKLCACTRGHALGDRTCLRPPAAVGRARSSDVRHVGDHRTTPRVTAKAAAKARNLGSGRCWARLPEAPASV
jgi:hypothetical protein